MPGGDSNGTSDVVRPEAEFSAADTAPVADASIDDLVGQLIDGTVVERRRAALALAERDPDPTAIGPPLARAATDDADPDVRQFAVEALGEVGGDAAGTTARQALDDPNPWVRAEAVVALDHLDREAHREAIERALDDDHHAVRRNAVVSTFKRSQEVALEPLLDLADDPSQRVREWVAHLLAGYDDDRAHEALRTLREDPVDLVAETAERSLETDPERFRRRFGDRSRSERSEDPLNRQPEF
jgi:HEAT repeat protein